MRKQKRMDEHEMCPRCGSDLEDTIHAAAYDWSVGLPSEIAVGCPECDLELEFYVEFDIRLIKVEAKEDP